MIAHGEQRALTCPVCLKRFERKFDLKQHQNRLKHKTHRFVLEPWEKYRD